MFMINTVLSTSLFEENMRINPDIQIVVIDILRATTTCVVALENGAQEIIPINTIEKAQTYNSNVYILAGERNGQKVDSFLLGNSPQEFTPEIVKNKKIVFTTTNGTKAIDLCGDHHNFLISSYRNISATIKHLIESQQDVLLFCSGWKGQVNIEDTLFAGEIIHKLEKSGSFTLSDDASHLALSLYQNNELNIKSLLNNASHVKRFKTLHIESDLDVCLQRDTYKKPVFYKNGIIQ